VGLLLLVSALLLGLLLLLAVVLHWLEAAEG
jgi:hypothetical protein